MLAGHVPARFKIIGRARVGDRTAFYQTRAIDSITGAKSTIFLWWLR
jgi:hypothetical protein